VSELSLFVDESGDFGTESDYYVVTLVLHEQDRDITAMVIRLAAELAACGLDAEHAIHTGQAIRGEDVYRGMPIEVRKREFTRLFAFARRVPATHEAFSFRKREFSDRLHLKGAISRALSLFLRDNAAYFLSFERVIVYYDNGQAEITDVLNTLFNAFFFEVDFRKVMPVQYRLFQVADLFCTLELLRVKAADGNLTRSDLRFFTNRRALLRDYLSKLEAKRFRGHR